MIARSNYHHRRQQRIMRMILRIVLLQRRSAQRNYHALIQDAQTKDEASKCVSDMAPNQAKQTAFVNTTVVQKVTEAEGIALSM